MSVSNMNLSRIHPAGPAHDDLVNILSWYLLDHPMAAGAFLSHPDTAAIAFLTPEHHLNVLSLLLSPILLMKIYG